MSDLTLRSNVLDELDYDPSVDAANIGVAASKGVVTLSGAASSDPVSCLGRARLRALSAGR